MQLVLDTSVLVAALRSRNGSSRKLLNAVLAREHRLIATPALFFEYESVLMRPEQREAHNLSVIEIEEFLRRLTAFTETTRIYYQWRPQLPDPKDEMVLEAAINGHAKALITFNVRDFVPAAKHFGIDVLPPGRIMTKRSLP